MTDSDYIKAFRDSDQRAISNFYTKHREKFLRDVGCYYRFLNSDLLTEIFQEAVVRLWKNITSGKLTENNLTTPLGGYLYGIGKLVAMEIIRREGISVKTNMEESEMSKLEHGSGMDILFERESEREKAVRKAVYKMGEPCAPLLLLFYWDKLSWEKIAIQLEYKDANSAKTQKYKCIQKLKSQFL